MQGTGEQTVLCSNIPFLAVRFIEFNAKKMLSTLKANDERNIIKKRKIGTNFDLMLVSQSLVSYTLSQVRIVSVIEIDLSLSVHSRLIQNYKVENEAFSYNQDIYDFIEVEKENISADEKKNSLFPCSFIS